MDAKVITSKKPFVSPTCEVIAFQAEDIITTSGEGGGFEGEWDMDIPEV